MTVIGNSFVEDEILLENRVPRRVTVVFLAGSAAVGKTAVLRELAKVAGKEAEVHLVGSTTRGTYERLGVENEKALAQMGASAIRGLQEQMFFDYLKNMRVQVDKACVEASRDAYSKRRHYVAVDRSPYDHLTYAMMTIPELSMAYIDEYLHTAEEAMDAVEGTHSFFGVKVAVDLNFCLFDYPGSWMSSSANDVHDDGFRVSTPARNYMWSLAFRSLLEDRIWAPKVPRNRRVSRFSSTDTSTPAQRARGILSTFGDYPYEQPS